MSGGEGKGWLFSYYVKIKYIDLSAYLNGKYKTKIKVK